MGRLTREQCDVFLLHLEILETHGCKAMSHEDHAHVQRSQRQGSNPMLDWAVDYSKCRPQEQDKDDLLVMAHGNSLMTWHQSRRAGPIVRRFYYLLQERRLYGDGLRYLRKMGT